MKSSVKILSVILILASIFGLVGGGIGLADVLDCKGYWEDKSVKSNEDLTTLEDGLNTLAENKQAYIDGLAAYEQGSKDYEDGQKTLEDGKKEYTAGQKTLEEKQKEYDAGLSKLSEAESKLAKGRETLEQNKQAYLAGKAQLAQYSDEDIASAKQAYNGVTAAMNQGLSEDQAVQYVAKQLVDQQVAAAATQVASQTVDQQVKSGIKNTVIKTYRDSIAQQNGAASYDALTPEQKQAVDGMINSEPLASQVNAAIETATAEQYDTLYNQYMNSESVQNMIKAGIANEMAANGNKYMSEAVPKVQTAYKNYPTLEAGLAQIAAYEAGLDEYNKGLEEYYAGRDTLLNGRGQLVEGKEKLEAAEKTINEGQKALNDAEKQLADGKAKLDEYESGQKQVIDGIETVLASETYGDLVSIADRLGPDFKYLDSKGILDIDQGLAVVATAREFSGDNGTVVTRELTLRAVGAVMAIIASVIALVAGAIGLIGSSKVAGIVAAVSAVVAVVAAILTPVAGTVMSAVAGSTVAAIVIAAAAVVAIVAIVNAVVDLATKKTTV